MGGHFCARMNLPAFHIAAPSVRRFLARSYQSESLPWDGVFEGELKEGEVFGTEKRWNKDEGRSLYIERLRALNRDNTGAFFFFIRARSDAQ